MPRRQRELVTATPILGRSLVASAARYSGDQARIYHKDSKSWQKEAYRHYRICGEARFSAQFFGHALSKAVLSVVSDPKSTKPLLTGPAVDRLDELFNGAGGQGAMLSAAGVHLTIAGEFYIIGRTGVPTADLDGRIVEPGADLWEVRSVMEVESNGVVGKYGRWWINGSGTQPRVELKPDDVVIRVWMPDPQDSLSADSPFRSLLPILEEIEWLTKYVFAQASARVSGAGLLIMPEEMGFPTEQRNPLDPEVLTDTTPSGALMRILAKVLGSAITDPSSVEAKIPSVITAPGEYIDKIKWQTFWSELDAAAQSLREEAIRRFALGMDLPPERVLGMSTSASSRGGHSAGANHWTAWQVDEDTIKMHIEPMLDVVVAALSVYYVRPNLADPSALNPTVIYDTSDLRLRPDRSQEALSLYDRGLIGAATCLRENGFNSDDVMSPDERKIWFLWKVAGGSATPDMVAEALRELGVPISDPPDSQGQLNEARPNPAIPDPERDLPDANNALIAACDALAFRALERAGNKIRGVIKNAGGEPPTCSSFDIHTFTPAPPGSIRKLLDDAWPHAEKVLEPIGVDVESTVAKLNGYVTSLLTSGTPHTRAGLVRWMGGEPPEPSLVA